MVAMVGSQAMILGKGPAHFMLNGRITEMSDEAIRQKLWTMRSEDIDRIEVLSIPSGRDMTESLWYGLIIITTGINRILATTFIMRPSSWENSWIAMSIIISRQPDLT